MKLEGIFLHEEVEHLIEIILKLICVLSKWWLRAIEETHYINTFMIYGCNCQKASVSSRFGLVHKI